MTEARRSWTWSHRSNWPESCTAIWVRSHRPAWWRRVTYRSRGGTRRARRTRTRKYMNRTRTQNLRIRTTNLKCSSRVTSILKKWCLSQSAIVRSRNLSSWDLRWIRVVPLLTRCRSWYTAPRVQSNLIRKVQWSRKLWTRPRCWRTLTLGKSILALRWASMVSTLPTPSRRKSNIWASSVSWASSGTGKPAPDLQAAHSQR